MYDDGWSRSTLHFWDTSFVTEDMEDQKAGAIALQSRVMPRSHRDFSDMPDVFIGDCCGSAIEIKVVPHCDGTP